MRILEIIPTLGSGGAERFVVDLSNELCEKDNVEVMLLTLYDISESDIFASFLSKRVRLYSLGKKTGLSITAYFRIFRLVRQIHPDIIHSHLDAIIYLLFSILFNSRTIKYYHTIHNDAYKEACGVRRFFRKVLFKWNLCTPVTISKISQDSFKRLYGRNAPLVFNGVSNSSIDEFVPMNYRLSNHTKILLNIGRVMKQKNHLMLLKVVSRLIAVGEDIVLLHIGRVEESLLFEELKSYINDRIIFLGEMQNVRPYLKYADFFCLTSLYEGLPISLLEAFSVGCIPVCTPVGGCVDVIRNSVTGFLSENLFEDNYYSLLKTVLHMEDEKKRRIQFNLIQEYEEKYSIKVCASQYLALFLE